MARPIAGIDEYKFGECGFVVDGALLKNGVKLKNVRIYKQRSIHTFDLIDPNSGTIYQKVQLTGYDDSSRVLDYSMTDDVLLTKIPVNSFYVRGYNDALSHKGFVIRFLTHKVVLSDGSHANLYDMYTPYCSIPTPELGLITISTVTVDSTTVTGSVSSTTGTLYEDGMVVTLTTPDGRVYTTTVVNRVFTFENVQFDTEGTGILEITSPHYNTKTIDFEVKPPTADTDYVTDYAVAASQFVDNGDGSYSYSLPESQHNRGSDIVVQLQANGVVYDASVQVDSDGNVTLTQTVKQDANILIIGKTKLTAPYAATLVWTLDGGVYKMDIPFSTHQKDNVVIAVYENTQLVTIEVHLDDSNNVTLISDSELTGKVVIAGHD
jgi:hypothetical protein